MEGNILIIDDDKDLNKLLRRYLEMNHYSVSSAYDGESGIIEAKSNKYQLIVLDVMLPLKDGFSVLTDIRRYSNVPILMLTAKDSEADKISGLRIGADDYLTKPFNMNEFIARVQSLIRRYTIFDNNNNFDMPIIEYKSLSITPSTRTVKLNGDIIELTAKEFDLLYFLAKNKNKVFTKQQIYHAVWHDEYAYDDNNIMVHIRRLRKKIEANPDVPFFIKTVWGVGYKFGE